MQRVPCTTETKRGPKCEKIQLQGPMPRAEGSLHEWSWEGQKPVPNRGCDGRGQLARLDIGEQHKSGKGRVQTQRAACVSSHGRAGGNAEGTGQMQRAACMAGHGRAEERAEGRLRGQTCEGKRRGQKERAEGEGKGRGQLVWPEMGGQRERAKGEGKGRGQVEWPEMGGKGKGGAHLSAMRAAAREEGQ